MIVRLIKNQQALVLCDGADRTAGKSCGPDSLQYSAPVEIQTRQYLRAHNAKPKYRGNGLEQIGFSISRLFASFDAAWVWLAGHRRELQDFQDSIAELIVGTSTTTLDDAVISIQGASLTGCSISVSYSLIGSKLNSTRGPVIS